MATSSLQAKSVSANTATVYSLRNAWRYAKAAWDIALYAPGRGDEDLPEEMEAALSNAEGEAFDRLMRAPVHSLADLSAKLQVFREQDGHQLTHAAALLAILAEDARHLQFTTR